MMKISLGPESLKKHERMRNHIINVHDLAQELMRNEESPPAYAEAMESIVKLTEAMNMIAYRARSTVKVRLIE